MKYLATALLALLVFNSFGQIKFTDDVFANGMRYPIAQFSSNQSVADTMNAIIQDRLMDAETSDFCIGDYGYFQKGNHIELHLICNCIDFEETDHRFLFFSLETGKVVPYYDLFEDKSRDEALKFINKKIRDSKAANACAQEFGEMTEDLDWSDFQYRLYKDGLEIHPSSGICNSPVKISWNEVRSLLKYNYL